MNCIRYLKLSKFKCNAKILKLLTTAPPDSNSRAPALSFLVAREALTLSGTASSSPTTSRNHSKEAFWRTFPSRRVKADKGVHVLTLNSRSMTSRQVPTNGQGGLEGFSWADHIRAGLSRARAGTWPVIRYR